MGWQGIRIAPFANMDDNPSTTQPAPMKPGDEAPSGTRGTGGHACPRCGGSGALGQVRCPGCEGTGKVAKAPG